MEYRYTKISQIFTERAVEVLERAQSEAFVESHPFVATDDLLQALVTNTRICAILSDESPLKISMFINQERAKYLGHWPITPGVQRQHLTPSPRTKLIIRKAIEIAERDGNYVTPEDLLHAIALEEQSSAYKILSTYLLKRNYNIPRLVESLKRARDIRDDGRLI